MATIASLVVSLSAITDKFESGFHSAQHTLHGFSDSVEHGMHKIEGFAAGLIALGAGIGFEELIRHSAESIVALSRLSQRLGSSTESLSELGYAAKLGGVGADEFAHSLEMMTRKIGGSTDELGGASLAIAKLGISMQLLKSQSPDEQFRTIAEAISHVQNASERAAITVSIFGRSGARMLNMLSGGRAGLEEAAEQARKLGISLNGIDAAKVELAHEAVTKLHAAFEGVANTIVIAVAPFVSALANQFVDLAEAGHGAGSIVSDGLALIVRAIAYIEDGIAALNVAWLSFKVAAASAVFESIAVLALFAKAMQNVMNAATGSHFTFGDDLIAQANGAQQAFLEAQAAFDKAWNDLGHSSAQADAEASIKKIQDAATKAAEELKKMRDAQSGGAGGIDPGAFEKLAKAQQDAEEMFTRLTESNKNFGLSADDAKIKMLEEAGVSAEMIQTLRDLAKAHEELAAKQKLMDEGKRLFEETRTPLEKYEETIGHLSDLLKAQALDWDTYGRLVRRAREELELHNKAANKPSLVERRLVAQFNGERFAASRAASPADALKSTVDKQLTSDEQRRKIQDDILRQIRDIGQNQPALVIF